ncbi:MULTISPECIES: hypothetical protein [Aliiglaciecola]|uniref:hypothetical protein n=1 Tax=Aliiglaciecola TaxID=1406885 RepID=UPI001C0839C6|nr:MULTISPECIES: hypothetical protein [Aliiglaciecola]MBU2876566.1 hypothetical protein [Aliiglaciecola lipolytica]MDO6711499.1 hypothetical protein [Aliiglaciecola sp. 2_MG-2023]MDO6752525.1 hypothetical protein [Aliiglaciecola sp. 1_MG-2023]
MKMTFIKLAALSLPFLVSSCASHHTRNSERNQFVTELYANVDQIYDVKFESHAGEAAASWGLWGALNNVYGSDRQILAGALIGAFFGGLLTSIEEGPSRGFEYHLTATDGEYLVVVLDYFPADEGECVRVRMANKVHMILVNSDYCQIID